MLRAGFVLNISREWFGGVYYFLNLFRALKTYGGGRILPEIFALPTSDPELLKLFEDVAGITMIDRARMSPCGLYSRIRYSLGKRYAGEPDFEQYAWARLFRSRCIDVISHAYEIYCASVPHVGWIPDFQHCYYPDFFSREELASRDRRYADMASRAKAVILSSEAAFLDYRRYYNGSNGRVVRFAVDVDPASASDAAAKRVREKFALEGDYLMTANQFWRHKDHLTLMRAMRLLAERGKRPILLCTGDPKESPSREYAEEVRRFPCEYGLENVRLAGLVNRADLHALMRNCRLLINPSLFEGWNTAVEEAKILGRRLILSDIPVHREQDPGDALFFTPENPESLAAAIVQALAKPVKPEYHSDEIRIGNESGMRRYAADYIAMVNRVAGH